jgi:hypothetical protein
MLVDVVVPVAEAGADVNEAKEGADIVEAAAELDAMVLPAADGLPKCTEVRGNKIKIEPRRYRAACVNRRLDARGSAHAPCSKTNERLKDDAA